MINLKIPTNTMIDNINRRIAFLRSRDEFGDEQKAQWLERLLAEYQERMENGETEDFVL